MKKMSIKASILLPTLAILIVGVIIMVVTVGSISSSTTNGITERLVSARVNEYANLFEAMFLDSYGVSLSLGSTLKQFSGMENARELVVDTLQETLMSNSKMLGIWTCWEPEAFDGNDSAYAGADYHDATGRFIPYVYKSGNTYAISALTSYETPGDGDYYLGARNSGKPYITDPFAYEVDGDAITMCTIAIPILNEDKVVGVVGVDISLESLIAVMNEGTILDDGYLFVISPSGLFATHPTETLLMQDYETIWMGGYTSEINNLLASGGSMDLTVFSDQLNTDIRFLGSSSIVAETGRNWIVCGIVPVNTVEASSTSLLWLVIAIGLILIAVVGFTIFIVVRLRLRELPVMKKLADNIAMGDVDLSGLDNETGETHNEIALLGRAFTSMANGIQTQSDMLAQIADGDYSMSVSMRCESDMMNKAINDMIERFQITMGGIHTATNQVAAGSKQIADGALALAQGSTQQAAAVEQLSASISEVSVKTKENADMAQRASHLAVTIKENAEKGNRQMDTMMEAVKEINQASQNINKVIKVIDDIAFQTNILALNAAVEAARAGQHGKGFAVVAEEVRNLAAKSAEAARDTGGLIANSMEKAGLGAKIAEETASSLADIVSGINESTAIVSEIARSSGEQTAAITQINTGIDQVAQVVQQNSATAEESAAASEEMSGQSDMLEQLISQFKLKDNNNRTLSAGSASSKKQLAVPQKASSVTIGDYGKY